MDSEPHPEAEKPVRGGRGCLVAVLALVAVLVAAAFARGACRNRPRQVEYVVSLVNDHDRARAPAWYRGLPGFLKHAVAGMLPSLIEPPPEGKDLVAEILRRDIPGWTMEQRTEFFAGGISGSVGWIEPWLLANLLLDPGNETGWNDRGMLEVPPSGVLPDWRDVRRRKRELEGPRADGWLVPFDVFFLWRIELVPSERGTELVLSRPDGSWTSRWETRIPAEHRPAIDPAGYDAATRRLSMEFGNFVRILTNDCNAQVYEIRPVPRPESVPGYDPDAPEIPLELCVPPNDPAGPEFRPPPP
jgi:hypothetical protein